MLNPVLILCPWADLGTDSTAMTTFGNVPSSDFVILLDCYPQSAQETAHHEILLVSAISTIYIAPYHGHQSFHYGNKS